MNSLNPTGELLEIVRYFRRTSVNPKRCFYCGVDLSKVIRFPRTERHDTQDHVIPRALGGSDASCNRVPCCKPCNEAKGVLDVEAFRRLRFAGKPVEFFAETLYRQATKNTP